MKQIQNVCYLVPSEAPPERSDESKIDTVSMTIRRTLAK